MCGISGIYGLDETSEAVKRCTMMNDTLAHRGPDDNGIFSQAGIALGHRRLSIIDLSSAGHQPMLSVDGRYAIVYNGELYNFKEIRNRLSEYSFQTDSDTEVILAAYSKWGRDCLQYFNGMFAFAIWDLKEQQLFIARDRLGIKPLYYYRMNNVLLFSSELRALLASGIVPRKLNKDGLVDYLRYQTVHAPATILDRVSMLMPGHYLTMDKNGEKHDRYWTLGATSSSAPSSYKEACVGVRQRMEAAVERRLVADVPFGAFLSGGIDSSAIVGLISKVATGTVKTFFINFKEEEFSESKYAKMVAEKFHTQHHEITLSVNDFKNELPAALQAMDHPSGDGPNTFLVSQVTKQSGITMALSGLGGDELFCGYSIFNRMHKLQQRHWVGKVPIWMRKITATTLKTLRPGVASEKIAALLKTPSMNFDSAYPLSRQVLMDERIAVLMGMKELPHNRNEEILSELDESFDCPDFLMSKVSASEISTYMQNVLLRDTDQMSMAHALEVRVPFLDYELVEYVMSLPDHYKDLSSPKKLLIDSLGDLLPDEIIHRPKMGFSFPWKHWMKNELRSFCEERIHSLSKRNLLNSQQLIGLWEAFLNNDPVVTWSRVWHLIVLEHWIQENNIHE